MHRASNPNLTRLTIGAAASVALHIVGVAAWVSAESPARDALAIAPPPADERDTPLGRERSQASTITWIGYETPDDRPHDAEQGEVEQAAFDTTVAQRLGQVARSAAHSAATLRDAIEAGLDAQLRAMAARESRLAELPRADAATPADPAPSRADAAADGEQQDDAAPTQGQPTAAASDRESIALSLTEPLRVVPGRPVAAEGIEIRTVRPRWTHTTTLTTRPGDAVVKVRFGPDGRVRTADLTRSTGVAFVDGPLMNAVYQWTASGKALAELEGGGPDPTLEVTFHIALR